MLLEGDTVQSDPLGNVYWALSELHHRTKRADVTRLLLPFHNPPQMSWAHFITHQETLSSVQGNQWFTHSSVGSFHQQSGVTLVGIDQVGQGLLVPRRRVSAVQPTSVAVTSYSVVTHVNLGNIFDLAWAVTNIRPNRKTKISLPKHKQMLCVKLSNVPFCPAFQMSTLWIAL